MRVNSGALFEAITAYVDAYVQHELAIHERDIHPTGVVHFDSSGSLRILGERTRELRTQLERLADAVAAADGPRYP